MPTYALLLEHGPRWDDARGIREQDGWAEHAAFMDALVVDGTIRLGGPLDDGGVLHCARAADEASLRQRLRDDPWHRDGLLSVASVRRWELWLDADPSH